MATAIAADFKWSRASAGRLDESGYRYVDGEIRQNGHQKISYDPLKIDGLYLKFSALGGSPEACVAFANTWGLLENQANTAHPPSESLAFWRREIKRMKGSIAMLPFVVKASAPSTNYRAVTQATVGSVNVLLVPNPVPDEKPRMLLKPHSLLQAMNLQLALWVTGGGTLITCEQCGEPFQAGIGKKRSIARFCSDLCRVQHHRRKA